MSEVMSCPHCSGDMQVTPELRGQTVRCPHCQKDLSIPAGPTGYVVPTSAPTQYQNVPSYLVWAILVTILCCGPFGIVAIGYAAYANGLKAAGAYERALSANKSARTWCFVSLFAQIALALLYGAFIALTVSQAH